MGLFFDKAFISVKIKSRIYNTRYRVRISSEAEFFAYEIIIFLDFLGDLAVLIYISVPRNKAADLKAFKNIFA